MAEDLYARALDSALDDVLRACPPDQLISDELQAHAVMRQATQPLPPARTPAASAALLSAVLADETDDDDEDFL